MSRKGNCLDDAVIENFLSFKNKNCYICKCSLHSNIMKLNSKNTFLIVTISESNIN